MSYPTITGVGLALPERYVPNQELIEQSGFNTMRPESIVRHVGIEGRYWIDGPGEHASDLATEAARWALKMAQVAPEDIEAIHLSTASPDYPSPSTASLVHGRLGGRSLCKAVDLNAACAGGVMALEAASAEMMAFGKQHTLAVGVEITSHGIDINDPRTAILFGDGAGAAHLEMREEADRPYFASMTVPNREAIYVPAAGHAKIIEGNDHTIKMNGKQVAENAGYIMPTLAHNVASQAGLATKDAIDWDGIDYFVPHQANKRMIEALRDGMGVPEEKCIITLEQTGNTSSSSIFIALTKAVERGEIQPGQKRVLFTSVGAGFVGSAGLVDVNLS